MPVPTITAEERKAGCCCKQEEKARWRIVLRLHCTGAGECGASGSCRAPYYSSLRLRSARRSRPSPCPGVNLCRSVPLLRPCGDRGCAGPAGAIAGAAPGQGRGCPGGPASPRRHWSVTSRHGRNLTWSWKFSLLGSNCTSWKQFNLHPNNLF